MRLTTLPRHRLWTRQFNRCVLLKRAGATPRTLWAAESRKSGVAPARFGSFSDVAFGFSFQASHSLSAECAATRVKTLEENDVQSEKVTFFTALNLGVPWERCPETTFEGPIENDDFNRNRGFMAIPLNCIITSAPSTRVGYC